MLRGMATRNQLCKILQAATGLDDFLIWRTADALGEAGLLPPSEKSEVLPEDAAVLSCGVTAARSPGEAVDVVEMHRLVSLDYVGLIEDGREVSMSPTEYEAFSTGYEFGALGGAFDWFEFMLRAQQPIPGLISATMQAEIGRGVTCPYSVVMPSLTLDIDGPTTCALRLIYRVPSVPLLPVCTMSVIQPGVFAHLAHLFAISSHLTEGAATAATVN